MIPFIDRFESFDNIAFRRRLQEPRNLRMDDRKWVEIIDMLITPVGDDCMISIVLSESYNFLYG